MLIVLGEYLHKPITAAATLHRFAKDRLQFYERGRIIHPVQREHRHGNTTH